jgi:hypothetical protein
VPGQDPSLRLPGRNATARWQISQRVTGSWVTITGKRREDDLLICLYDASPAGDLAFSLRHPLHAACADVGD